VRARHVRLVLRVGHHRRHVRVGRPLPVRVRLAPVAHAAAVRAAGRLGGHRVNVQARRHGHWHTVGRGRTGHRGRFHARLHARHLGRHALRVRLARHPRTHRRAGRLTVLTPRTVSWYGPGLYGGRLACGGRLEPGTSGVASKSLPCGTMVTLRHHGHRARVPVVDRGPYVGGRTYDLTAAVAGKLHFSGVGRVLASR
jgi:hypothetical protein